MNVAATDFVIDVPLLDAEAEVAVVVRAVSPDVGAPADVAAVCIPQARHLNVRATLSVETGRCKLAFAAAVLNIF